MWELIRRLREFLDALSTSHFGHRKDIQTWRGGHRIHSCMRKPFRQDDVSEIHATFSASEKEPSRRVYKVVTPRRERSVIVLLQHAVRLLCPGSFYQRDRPQWLPRGPSRSSLAAWQRTAERLRQSFRILFQNL